MVHSSVINNINDHSPLSIRYHILALNIMKQSFFDVPKNSIGTYYCILHLYFNSCGFFEKITINICFK